jgi:hypothetical protein
VRVGDTFLFPLNSQAIEHLWIVVTNPDPNDCVLVVNVTTLKSNDKDSVDGTVCLNAGEHPFLTKEQSYVYYRGAEIKKISDLRSEETAGRLQMRESCSTNVISLVRSGFGASIHCTRVIKSYYDKSKNIAIS